MSGAISAQRRHHIKRLRRHWRSTLRSQWPRAGKQLSADPSFVGIMATTPARCSCHMCGNPRKWFGQSTRQEKRADLEMHEQLEHQDVQRPPG